MIIGLLVSGFTLLQQGLFADKFEKTSIKWFNIIAGGVMMLIGALNLTLFIQS